MNNFFNMVEIPWFNFLFLNHGDTGTRASYYLSNSEQVLLYTKSPALDIELGQEYI